MKFNKFLDFWNTVTISSLVGIGSFLMLLLSINLITTITLVIWTLLIGYSIILSFITAKIIYRAFKIQRIVEEMLHEKENSTS